MIAVRWDQPPRTAGASNEGGESCPRGIRGDDAQGALKLPPVHSALYEDRQRFVLFCKRCTRGGYDRTLSAENDPRRTRIEPWRNADGDTATLDGWQIRLLATTEGGMDLIAGVVVTDLERCGHGAGA